MNTTTTKLKVAAFLYLLIFSSAGWGSENFESAFMAAAQQCEFSVSPSRRGSCLEQKFTAAAPDWTDTPRARYIAAFFPFADKAGEKLESGEWDQQQYDNALVSFINRMKIQVAEDERLARERRRSAAAESIDSFFRGFNSGITCYNYGAIIKCR